MPNKCRTSKLTERLESGPEIHITSEPASGGQANPADKAMWARHYIENMIHAVGVIGHSCGARAPRRLRRFHAHVVAPDDCSVPTSEMHGYVEPTVALAGRPTSRPGAPVQ